MASPSARTRWRGSGIAKIGKHDRGGRPGIPPRAKSSGSAFPTFVPPGPDNPMGSRRPLYLYSGRPKDNPVSGFTAPTSRNISASRSLPAASGWTNEDVIDLYNRVKPGHHRRGAWSRGTATSPFKGRRWRCKPAASAGPMMQ